MITLLLTRGHKRLQDITGYHRILHRYLNDISLRLKEIKRNYKEVKKANDWCERNEYDDED